MLPSKILRLVAGLMLFGCIDEPDYLGRLCDERNPCPDGLFCGADDRCTNTMPPPQDMGVIDLGEVDLGFDLGPEDLGPEDLGPMDMGPGDTGPTPDSGPVDMGNQAELRCMEPVNYPTIGWEGRYFILAAGNNFGPCFGVEDIAGDPLDLAFGASGPLGSPNVSFASQFTARRTFQRGVYTFTLHHDDGMRLFIDNTLVYENWEHGDAPNVQVTTPYLTAGPHDIRIEHFDDKGFAVVRASNARGCLATQSPSTGWFLTYHPIDAANNIITEECFGTETIPVDMLQFVGDAPAPVIAAGTTDNWAMVGRAQRNLEGMTRFGASHDDGMRIFANGMSIYDGWQLGPIRPGFGSGYFVGPTDILFEKFDTVQDGRMLISWIQACDDIPATNPGDWFAAYYRVTMTTNPDDWQINRGDCLGTEVLTGPTLVNIGTPQAVTDLSVSQLWGADYTSSQSFGMGTTVNLTHDDGLRVFRDGAQVYEDWTAPLVISTTIFMPQGSYPVRLEYFQNFGGTQVQFTY